MFINSTVEYFLLLFVFLGSPALRDPIIVWNGKQSGPLSKLVLAGKNEVRP